MLYFALIVVGSLITFSLYHFLVFLGRSKVLINLVFSGYCLGIIGIQITARIIPKFRPFTLFVETFFFLSIALTAVSMATFGYLIQEMQKRLTGLLIKGIIITIVVNTLVILVLIMIFQERFYLKFFFYPLSVVSAFYIILIIVDLFKTKAYTNHSKLMVIIGFGIALLCSTATAVIKGLDRTAPIWLFDTSVLLNALIYGYVLIRGFNKEHFTLIEKEATNRKLEEANSKLAEANRKLAETKYELENVNEKLRDMNQQQTNFFINIAHETKTPLTLIDSYLSKYRESRTDADLDVVQKNIRKLKRDMVNFLDIQKSQKGRLTYNHSWIIDVSTELTLVIKSFTELAKKKDIELTSSIDHHLYIQIDPVALERILLNLIDNAIKYTDPQGKVNAKLSGSQKLIMLNIEDSGIGMSKEHQKHIFNPYYQISQFKKNSEGLGMGLSIIKAIMDEIDGSIDIKSELGRGTAFTLSFHRYYLQPGETADIYNHENDDIIRDDTPELLQETYSQDKKTILIVEDNIAMLSLLQTKLYHAYNIYYALNGKLALEKLPAIPKPDIIISDIMMDEMNGYDFRQALGENPNYALIPFIFLTAKSTELERLKGLNLGAFDYIVKPFNINELVIKIGRLIEIEQNTEDKVFSFIKNDFQKSVKMPGKKPFTDFINKYKITPTEIAIIELLHKGFELKEIADERVKSINTINNQVRKIYKKLSVQNKREFRDLLSHYDI